MTSTIMKLCLNTHSMTELTANMINPEREEFWDEDHAMTIIFKDGTRDEFCVPYLWCWMDSRDELIKFVVDYNELEDVDYSNIETGCVNG